MKKYQKENREKIKVKRRNRYLKRKDKEQAGHKKYYEENKSDILTYRKSYEKENRSAINEYRRNKLQSSIKWRLRYSMSNQINRSLKGNKNGHHWEDLVGYTVDDLIKRLKKTLPKGYNWQDYIAGKTDLHIDHIIPIKAFNFQLYEDTDFKRCWSLSNLRLLPKKENISKGAKLNYHFQPSLTGF